MDGVGVPSVDSGVELLYGVEQFGVEVGEDAVDVELPGCGFAGWAFGRLGILGGSALSRFECGPIGAGPIAFLFHSPIPPYIGGGY